MIAESYEKAVDEDTILMYNEAFTFHIKGKTKYGGALAAGGGEKTITMEKSGM